MCTPGSGSTFALGSTDVTCESSDATGNNASKKFVVTVRDTTAPVVNPLANLTLKATSADGTVAAACRPASGSTFTVGVTTVSCAATDAVGNTSAPATLTVTVTFDKTAFLAPVDGNKVLNGMKNGSTAPLKWQISNGQGG